MTPNFQTGAALLGCWLADVESGKAPIRFALPEPFAEVDLRPGRIVAFGAPPGAGKTAAALQIVFEALRASPDLRAVFACVEMSPTVLLNRIVARCSGVPAKAFSERTATPEQLARARLAVRSIEPMLQRLAFAGPPFSLQHVASVADSIGAKLVAVDYLQRLKPGTDGKNRSDRENIEDAMSVLRRFADSGAAVLAISALGRLRGPTGSSTYAGANLASFRGSSEIEYGCDQVFLLRPSEANIFFDCLKNRNDAMTSFVTQFDGPTFTFRPAPSGLGAFDATQPAKLTGRRSTGQRSEGGSACDT